MEFLIQARGPAAIPCHRLDDLRFNLRSDADGEAHLTQTRGVPLPHSIEQQIRGPLDVRRVGGRESLADPP